MKIEDIEKTIKPKSIPLRDVEALEEMQPRLRLNHDAVRRYKTKLRQDTSSEPFPPILVMDRGPTYEGPRFVVVDGHHRLLAHQETNQKKIRARVVEVELKTAKLLAVLANLKHGVPLKSEDYREGFRRYVEAGANVNEDGSLQSYREIRTGLGGFKSPQTLMRWMKIEYPETAAEMAHREDIEQPQPFEYRDKYKPYLIQSLEDCIRDLNRLGYKAAKEGHGEDFAWSLVRTVEALSPYYGGASPDPEIAFKRLLEIAQRSRGEWDDDDDDEL